jgi:hypothetical protein
VCCNDDLDTGAKSPADAMNRVLLVQSVAIYDTTLTFQDRKFNRLASELYILIIAHPVCKILITQKTKKVALRNKRHF